MPQLMPLMWIFSSTVIFMVFVSSFLVYSNSLCFMEMKYLNSNTKEIVSKWCW